MKNPTIFMFLFLVIAFVIGIFPVIYADITQLKTNQTEYLPGEIVIISGQAEPLTLAGLEVRDTFGTPQLTVSVWVTDDGTFERTFRLSESATLGNWTVFVTQNGTLKTTIFSVISEIVSLPPPNITDIIPSTSEQGKTVIISILGENFEEGSNVEFSPPTGITINTLNFESSNEILVNISISKNSPLGLRNVTIINEDNQFHTLIGSLEITRLILPDATIEEIIIIPENPEIGDEVFFSASVKNIGDKNINDIVVEFVLDDLLFETFEITVIKGSSEIIQSTTPWEATVGNHDLEVVIDSNNSIEEMDESNNSLEKIFSIIDKKQPTWSSSKE
jgi:hypothetical protein